MAHVFISFSSRDREAAESIRAALERNGIQCWMAPYGIQPGVDWPRSLIDAIEASHILLVVLTHSANDSPHVALEVAHAIAHQRLLLVVRTEAIEPTGNIAYFLALSQRMDIFPPPLSQYLNTIADNVKSLLTPEMTSSPRENSHPLASPVHSACIKQEQFTDATNWQRLIRIGNWSLEATTACITGHGMFSYLLSSDDFGERPFVISASLIFDGYARYARNLLDTANAGFVLGWENGPVHIRYIHMLLNGERLLFERIGSRGGDSYTDFEHLENGVPFHIEDGREYNFQLQVSGNRVLVFIDGECLHNYNLPVSLVGRLGIRPWRASVVIRNFTVSEQ